MTDDPKQLAEEYAQRFHETYERLAPECGYETRRESAVPWADVPEPNRLLMIAVVGEVLQSALDRAEAAERRFSEFFDAIDAAAKQDRLAGDSSVEITLYGWDETRRSQP